MFATLEKKKMLECVSSVFKNIGEKKYAYDTCILKFVDSTNISCDYHTVCLLRLSVTIASGYIVQVDHINKNGVCREAIIS